MSEAIEVLRMFYVKVLGEVWANPEGKRNFLAGIDASIKRLKSEREERDDRGLQDVGY